MYLNNLVNVDNFPIFDPLAFWSSSLLAFVSYKKTLQPKPKRFSIKCASYGTTLIVPCITG
jgi:hypothetical protein